MQKKRFSGFTVFVIIMALIALLGVGMLIYGGMTHTALPKASPWTLARCMQHG